MSGTTPQDARAPLSSTQPCFNGQRSKVILDAGLDISIDSPSLDARGCVGETESPHLCSGQRSRRSELSTEGGTASPNHWLPNPDSPTLSDGLWSIRSRYTETYCLSSGSASPADWRSYVERIPASTSGIALGLCGFAGLWGKMGSIQGWSVSSIVCGLLGTSTFFFVSYVPLKLIVCFKVFRYEIMQPPVIAAIAAIPMATMEYGSNLCTNVDQHIGGTFAIVGGALQLFCMLLFFALVYTQRIPPEPYWFPPTVSIAVTALSGAACGWEPWLVQGCFYGALLIMFGILPVAFYRVLRHPYQVALGPACNMLCAPASLNSLVWHVVGKPYWPGPANNWMGISLFALAMVVWVSTLASLFARRAYWIRLPFSPAWAAFTFPTASTAQAVLYAYEAFLPDSFLFDIFHWIMFMFCNIVIVFVVANFIKNMPSWLTGSNASSLPPVDACSVSDTNTTGGGGEAESEAEGILVDVLNKDLADPAQAILMRAFLQRHASREVDAVIGYEIGSLHIHPCRRRASTISVGALQRGLLPPTEYVARKILETREDEELTPRERSHTISVGALQSGRLPRSEQESVRVSDLNMRQACS